MRLRRCHNGLECYARLAIDGLGLAGLSIEVCDVDLVRDAFADLPTDLQQTAERYTLCRNADEGDDLPTLAVSLHWHRMILDHAIAHGKAVVHALHLC